MEAFMKRFILVIGLILTVCFGFAESIYNSSKVSISDEGVPKKMIIEWEDAEDEDCACLESMKLDAYPLSYILYTNRNDKIFIEHVLLLLREATNVAEKEVVFFVQECYDNDDKVPYYAIYSCYVANVMQNRIWVGMDIVYP